jgi:NifU-like protein involved in Fe-S cluster formation
MALVNAPLYNARILRLAASIPHLGRLEAPQASAQRVSPVCGSRVTADVVLDSAGRVVEFAQEVRACALGQAAAAILGQAVLGQDAARLRSAHVALVAWLRSDDPLPAGLAAGFPDLELFAPARAHPARHASIALAFDAAAAAAEQLPPPSSPGS